ncbi:hypothetical protein Tco_1402281 [Tanacetum coccineum]
MGDVHSSRGPNCLRTPLLDTVTSMSIRVIPKYHSEYGNPARANIKQALGSYKDGDGVILFRKRQWPSIKDKELQEQSIQVFKIRMVCCTVSLQDTRSHDGERPQADDQRLDLADDLKESQDHISSTITSHKIKITTSKYKIYMKNQRLARGQNQRSSEDC